MYKILKAEKLADKIYLMDVEAPRVARENVSHLQSVTMTEKQVLLQSYSRKSEHLL